MSDKKTVLLIDPSENDQTLFVLIDGETVQSQSIEGTHRELLQSTSRVLEQWGLEPQNIAAIGVVVGAGRFTSTRIAATIANTFHFVSKANVFGMSKNDVQKIIDGTLMFQMPDESGYLSPEYSAPPSIGTPKK